MLTTTIAFIIGAFLLATLVVYFQYVFKEKKLHRVIILALLRFTSVFGILILLINPKIQQKFIEIVKPKLFVAIDNSSSVLFSSQDSALSASVLDLKNNRELKEKFEIDYFTFGSSVQNGSELTFKENQTNIEEIVQSLNSLAKQQIAPIILLGDGNQTYGRDYKFMNSNQPIYPVIFGDTAKIEDIEINKINVNSYSFLNNNFPVEIFLKYTGNESVDTNLIIEESNRVIYKKFISFSKENYSSHIQLKLPANKVGKHLFKARIEPFEDEINTINNFKNFSVEVIDEQSNIVIFYDVLHPDIGMLKRSIESNEQRKVHLVDLNTSFDFDDNIDLYILYQPNNKFENIFNEILNLNNNYFIITGKQTDWSYLNQAQSIFKNNVLTTTEKYFANFNINFNKFKIEDIGFNDYPPLEGFFGEVSFSSPYESILTQSINGIETENPLWVTFTDLNNKSRGIVLFGENLWKWRAISYSKQHSFDSFDQFINSNIQYLTISKQTNPIELQYNSFYYTDEPIKILAKIYDSNFNFDLDAELKLNFDNENNERPFYFNGNDYELNLHDLKHGEYSFSVRGLENNKSVIGSFNVLNYSIEQENLNANKNDLKLLADNSQGKIYYPNQFPELYDFLLNNQNFASIQTEKIKTTSLIDWKWLLGIIMLSLSLEWIIRKYKGLI